MRIRDYDIDPVLGGGFGELRARIYAGDPNVSPGETARLVHWLDDRDAFYRQPGSRHRHFAALADGQVIGHVSAFVNPGLRDADGSPFGALGFFECVDAEGVGDALLDAGLAWLRAADGDARVLAPMNHDIWHGYRFRTRGFTSHAFPGEPVNPSWYPALFERRGFAPVERWESIEVRGAGVLRPLVEPCLQRYEERLADGYRFVPVDPESDLTTLHRLVVDSFTGFLGFTPIAYPEFEALYGPLWSSIDLRFAGLAVDPAGEPVGFQFAYPVGERVIFYMIGINRHELERRHGLGRAAFADIMLRILDAGCAHIVFALMSQRSLARSGLHSVEDRAQTEHTLYLRSAE